MTAKPEQGISRKLSLGENISKTFELFRRDFEKYFALFSIVGIVIQVLTTLVQQTFVLPTTRVNPTPQQIAVPEEWSLGLWSIQF